MELRNRAGGVNARQDDRGKLHDVTLGPTVYAGERYGKMSERIKRQQRRMPDVNTTANRMITPRLIGLAVALLCVFLVIFWLQFQATQRRNRRKQG